MPSVAFKNELLALIPAMRGMALTLTRRRYAADDLVQETLCRAWEHHDSFTPDTNLKAWVFTILRNTFFTQYRKETREIADSDGRCTAHLCQWPEQLIALEMKEMQAALSHLPEEKRQAVTLVGALGFSYEEAAEMCKVQVGTIKSRTSRARAGLKEAIGTVEGQDMQLLGIPHNPNGTFATLIAS